MRYRLALLLVLVLGLSCQTPTQPIVKVTNERVVVNIRETTNQPVPNIDVALSNDQTGEYYGGKQTDQNGDWEQTVSVPTSGRPYKLRIGDPLNTQNQFGVTYDSVFLRCSDTTIYKRIHRVRLLQCNGVSSEDSASLNVCFDSTRIADTAESPWITTNGCTLNLSWLEKLPPGVTVHYAMKSGNTWITLGGPPSQLKSTDTLLITTTYAPKLGGDRSDNGSIVASVATTPASTYTFDLFATTHAHCRACQCPGNDWTPTFNNGNTPKVCAGDDSVYSFSVAGIVNTSKDANCVYEFSLETDFPDAPELQASLSQSTLAAGQSMQSIRVNFAPTSAPKLYDETAVYKIRVRASDGTITDCQQKLKLHVKAQSVGPICNVDAKDLLNGETFNGKKYNMSQCVDQTDHSTTITIRNDGDCPLLTPVTINFAGNNKDMFTATPAAVTFIPAHDTVQVKLTFKPTTKDAWPSGNTCDVPITDFPVTLNIQNCNPTTYNLIAYANPNCHRDITMGVSDSAVSKVGLEIDTSNDAVTTSDSLHIGSWTLYFTKITGGGNGTAVLQSASISGRYYCYFTDPAQCAYVPGEQICDNPKCCYVNNDACSFSNTTPKITIQAHHYYLFHYYNTGFGGGSAQRCGLIHVDDIIHDNTSNKDFVNIEFCFPIQ
jgi:hypothetical protein